MDRFFFFFYAFPMSFASVFHLFARLKTLETQQREMQLQIEELESVLRHRQGVRLPPPALRRYVGPGNFYEIGLEFFERLKASGLEPEDRVLDLGCGSGRIALHLVDYLGEGGSYLGLDINAEVLGWCRENLVGRGKAAFSFELLDASSRHYAGGAGEAGKVRFPVESGSRSFAFLTSLYSHLLPEAVGRYTEELGRVLCEGGRLVVTGYFLDGELMGRLGREKERFAEECLVDSLKDPEAVVYLG
ncbi:MAG TPA: class I SAM-dependent methyltransferase, partial [Planctomycetes bacterium]|nr:class I SAM-dependent methyltransferase [Planctomycetota bacterium]